MLRYAGLLGLCGNNDLRSVIEMSDAGDPRGVLALKIFVYRIRKYIGSYMAALGGDVDAVIFSAGIGENSPLIRSLVCQGMQAGH
jgi:acetate kinase